MGCAPFLRRGSLGGFGGRVVRAALLGLFIGYAGCAHRVALISDPIGAQVKVNHKSYGTTPVEVVLWSFPFSWKQPRARLTFPGYRPVTLDLSVDRRPLKRVVELLTLRWRKAFALIPASDHEVQMIQRHGPVGSWDPDDID